MQLGPAPQPGKSLPTAPGLRIALFPLDPHCTPAPVSDLVFCSAVAHVPLKASGKGRAGIGHLPLFFLNVLLWEISNMQ